MGGKIFLSPNTTYHVQVEYTNNCYIGDSKGNVDIDGVSLYVVGKKAISHTSKKIYILVGRTYGDSPTNPVDMLTAFWIGLTTSKVSDTIKAMYPNANIITNTHPDNPDALAAFSDPDAIGIVYIGHGGDSFLDTYGIGLRPYMIENATPLEFFLGLSCGSDVAEGGKTFAGVTKAKYSRGYDGRADAKMIYATLEGLFLHMYEMLAWKIAKVE